MFYYNDNDLSDLINITYVKGRGPISQEVNRMSIPWRAGSFYQSRRKPERILEVSFELVGYDLTDIRTKVDYLNSLLDVDVPGSIVFSDEPNKTYYGLLDSEPDWNEYLLIGKGTLKFVCFDPYKYGLEQSVAAASGKATINNQGTALAYPIIKTTVAQPLTFLDVLCGNEYMRIGQPVEEGETVVDPQTQILHDTCGSLVGWTASSSVLDGSVSGVLKTSGFTFYTDDYGSGSDWHGPAMKKSLSQPLQDFSLEVYLTQKPTSSSQVGRVMVELLDASNNPVARLQMWRRYPYANTNYALFEVFNSTEYETIYHKTGSTPWTWNEFEGVLRLNRKGNEWEYYIAQIDPNTNEHHSRDGDKWLDSLSKFTAQVTQVLVHVGTFGTYPATTQNVTDISVYQLNSIDDAVPYIAQAGDVIEMNHLTRKITINGQPALHLKDFGASFFPLSKGVNIINVSPTDAGTVEIKYQERFL